MLEPGHTGSGIVQAISILKLAMVGLFTPQKWATATKILFPQRAG